MKPKFFILFIAFFVSFLVSAQQNPNLYPHYQTGPDNVTQYIIKSGYGITRQEISSILPLEVNGNIAQGTVKSKWDRNVADIDVYEIKVEKEGLLSIVAKPSSYDNKRGSLRLQIFTNDARKEGGTVLQAWMAKTNSRYKRDDGWYVVDSYSFYAYPGTYYLKVEGKYGDVEGKHDYIPLVYQIGLIQDDNVNSYSGNLGKEIGPYYPNDLGHTVLKNDINIVSSLNMEQWIKRKEGSNLASKSASTSVNYRDKFKFTATTSGTVFLNLSTFTTDAMKVWHRAWQKVNKNDISELPLFTVQVSGYGTGGKPIDKSTGSGTMEVVAGKEYTVTIRCYYDRPAYYGLVLSYTKP